MSLHTASADTAPATSRPAMSRALTLLLALTGGVAIGNLYWAQPLLKMIGDDLGVSSGTAGALLTATQLAYAAGILLIVPLGDVLDRRQLIPAMLVCSSVALVACALAPTFGTLMVAITLLGVTTVAGQVIIPLAGDLADDATRGRVLGTVMAGFLSGTLVSRTLSGFVADAAGWRAIFGAAAVAVLVLAALTYRSIPSAPARARLRYPALLASIGAVVRQHRAVRWTLLLGALQFGLFMMFWTALTLLLTAPPFDYSVSAVGLFGLLGLVGAVAATHTGRLHDRGWSLPATGAGWALALLALALVDAVPHSAVVLGIGILLLHLAIFPMNVLLGARLFEVASEGRSRVNTAFVTVNFVAGAIGSAVVGPLWSAGGWRAVTTVEIAVSVVGLAVWAVGRHAALLDQPRRTHRRTDSLAVPTNG
jgi:predicted MFS family arabinose efflux permease